MIIMSGRRVTNSQVLLSIRALNSSAMAWFHIGLINNYGFRRGSRAKMEVVLRLNICLGLVISDILWVCTVLVGGDGGLGMVGE